MSITSDNKRNQWRRKTKDQLIEELEAMTKTLSEYESIHTGECDPDAETNRQYRRLFDSAAGGIGRTRVSDGKVLLANKRMAEMFGYENSDEFMTEFKFSNHYPSEKNRAEAIALYEKHPGKTHQVTYTRRDGSFIYAEAEVRLDKENGYIDFVIVDISERYRIEESLRKSEALVDALVQHSPVALSVKDVDGRYKFISPAFTNYLNVPAETALGKRVSDLLEPETASLLSAIDSEILNSKSPMKPGGAFPVEFGSSTLLMTKFPILDSQNEVTGIGTVGIDTSAQVRGEEILREQEALLRSLIDNMPAAILLTNSKGKYQAVNRIFLDWFGIDENQVLGKSPGSFLSPEESAIYQSYDKKVRETRQIFEEEIDASYPDGKDRRTLAIRFPVMGSESTTTGVGTIILDVSDRRAAEDALQTAYDDLERQVAARTLELRRSEELFRGYFDLGLIGMAVASPGKGLLTINDKLCEIIGYSREELTKLTWLDITHPDDVDANILLFNQVLAGETDGYTLDKRFIRKDGGIIYASVSTRCVRKEDNDIDYFVSLVQDITGRVEAEEVIRRSQKMDAIGQLTGGIAHDFNNILGVIIGNLSLLKDQAKSEEELLKRVTTIDGAAHRAAELVKQLLGFSRQQATDVVVGSLNRIIEDMDSLIKRSITPEIEVDKQLAEDLWLVGINPGDFQDALLNLILNARDAMPGGGTLTIGTSNCTLSAAFCAQHPNFFAGEYVRLSVNDIGTGMTLKQQDKIYDPFYTTKPVGKGTGLGLSMVFGFVTRSNGYIDVESEPGAGTTFHLYLPRATESALPENIADQLPDALPMGNATILVVDDEKELLDLAEESLEMLGYHVLTASNGKEAVERLTEHSDISLLFSDVVMPGGMNGYELAEQAMANRFNLKILLTSGHTEKAGVQAEQKYNLIMKPYTLKDLAGQVQSLLGESKTRSS